MTLHNDTRETKSIRSYYEELCAKNGNQEDIENSKCTHLTKTESHTYTNPENIAQ